MLKRQTMTATAVLICVALAIGGCGRRGTPELPRQAVAQPEDAVVERTTDRAQPEPRDDKPFFLDILL